MLFTSYEFIGFIFALAILYYVFPKKLQWMLLLLFSYLFYWIANPIYLIYIAVTTVTIWGCGRMIERNFATQSEYLKANKESLTKEEKKAYKNRKKSARGRWLLLGVLVNLGILAVVKYTDFIVGIFTGKGLGFMDLAVPMGISFYTFQAIGYLIDVKRGTVKAEKNLFKFALFVSFFPQLVQGPISRFGDLSQTLYAEHRFDWTNVSYGIERIMWGFFKKLIIADRVAPAVNVLISDVSVYHGAYAFVGMVLYTLELYADFTGGIDVTIGVAQMLGIRVTENFNRPYFSTSLKEYWRRWHITMCQWFREFVFYPVSTSKAIQGLAKFSRKHFGDNIGKKLPVYVSTFVVWFATGIWHGASWNFIVWGLLNWLILMVSEELEPLYDKFHGQFRFSNTIGYRIFMGLRTLLLICVLNMFDCYVSVSETFHAFLTMFTSANYSIFTTGELLNLGVSALDYIILLCGVVVMLIVSMVQVKGSVRDQIAAKPYPVRFVIWFALFLVILLVGAYGIGYDSSQFIYNRF